MDHPLLNVAFTVREVSDNVQASVDILELAGANHVLQLGEMPGQMLARRLAGGITAAHVIGRFEELIIAEATVRNTELVGQNFSNMRSVLVPPIFAAALVAGQQVALTEAFATMLAPAYVTDLLPSR